MKKIYKIYAVLAFLIALLLTMLPAEAAGKMRLMDEYDVFSTEEEARVAEKLEQLSVERGIDYFVIFPSAFANPTDEGYRSYVESFFSGNGYGEEKTGAVLLVDMENRKIHVRGFGKMYPVFASDSNIDKVTELVGSALRASDYEEAVNEFLQESYTLYRRYNRSFLQKLVDMMISLKGLGIALAGAALITVGVRAAHNRNTKPKAAEFEVAGSFKLVNKQDVFSHKNVTSRRIERSNSSGGGGSSSGGSSGGTRSF